MASKEKDINKKSVKENVINQSISEYAERAYLEYAMSVVKGRAIPSVEDGLKPVHRRILYAMFKEGMVHTSVHKKSARVVGNVLGLYHPHGDQSVYEALVRQAQNFSVRYPLIDGQGNFGSRDGDTAASMRYCFTGDTRVMTEKGLVKIIDIPHLNQKPNDQLVVLDTFVSSIKYKQKATKWIYSGVQDILRLTTEKGFIVECTPNEPLYVLNENLEFVWKNAEELKLGDRVALKTNSDIIVQSHKPLPVQIPLYPNHMSVDLAKFLGFLLSDGTMRLSGTSVEFGSSTIEIINEYKSLVQKLFPHLKFKERRVAAIDTIESEIVSKLDHYYITINSVEFVNFLSALGVEPNLAVNKKIPEVIFQSSQQEVAAFISAFYEGDGSITVLPSGLSLSLASSSMSILESMKQLLLNYFGIISNKIHLDKENIGRNSIYRIQITTSEDILKFRKLIGFRSERKNQELSLIKPVSGNSMGFRKNYIPHLSTFLTSYFNKLNISAKYMFNETGTKVLKQEIFKDFNLAKFKKIKTEFKLKHYLSNWSNEAKQNFPSLYQRLNDLLEHEFYYDKLVKNEALSEKKPVYDLTVQNTHAFVANGFVAHNTEAKLSPITQLYLEEIRDHCVDFMPNYDGSEEEPKVLPARIPFILLNGNPGIAVGMATDVPCHNITEVIQAIIAYLENDQIELSSIMEYIKGPDFPTGGQIISSKEEIMKMYSEGRGSIRLRSKYKIEGEGSKNWKLVFHEIPHGVSVKKVMEEIDIIFNPEDKVKKDAKGKEKKITPEQARLKTLFNTIIGKYTDASDKDNPVRLVVEPKSFKQDPQELIQALLAYTSLETNIAANFVVVGRDGRPVQKNLMEIIYEWTDFRLETIEKRVKYHLEKIAERLHILEGRKIILNHIDEVVRIIKNSETPKEDLMKRFGLSEIQAQDVLELKLRQIGKLELESIIKEISELTKRQEELRKIISSEKNLKKQMIKELNADLAKFGDQRVTEIKPAVKTDISAVQEKTALVAQEDITLAVSQKGWVKVIKGQKTLEEIAFKEGDKVDYHFYCKNTDTLCIFDVDGKVYNYSLLELGKDGAPINTLAQMGNKVSLVCPINKDHKYVLAQDSGFGFIVSGENLMTRLKAGKEMMTIVDGGKILQPLFFANNEDISQYRVGVITTENRYLMYKLDNISEIGKGKGVTICGLHSSYKIKEIKLLREPKAGFKAINKNGKTQQILLQGEELMVFEKGRATKGSFLPLKDKMSEVNFN